ncbi:MAG TPA: hypothetical protein VGL83_13945 [Stellaceae bacterium]|jgi:dihydroxy-acid dehydratase
MLLRDAAGVGYAMGVTEEQLAQAIVGVATTWNEAAPCNISLSRQAQAR